MHMRVDESRDRGAAPEIHDLDTGRRLQVVADGDDPAAIDQHATDDRVIRIQRMYAPVHEHDAGVAILSLCRGHRTGREPESQ